MEKKKMFWTCEFSRDDGTGEGRVEVELLGRLLVGGSGDKGAQGWRRQLVPLEVGVGLQERLLVLNSKLISIFY